MLTNSTLTEKTCEDVKTVNHACNAQPTSWLHQILGQVKNALNPVKRLVSISGPFTMHRCLQTAITLAVFGILAMGTPATAQRLMNVGLVADTQSSLAPSSLSDSSTEEADTSPEDPVARAEPTSAASKFAFLPQSPPLSSGDTPNLLRFGYSILIPPALDLESVNRIISEIEKLKTEAGSDSSSSSNPRKTIVLHFTGNAAGELGKSLNSRTYPQVTPGEGQDDATVFEDQLKLARYLTSPSQRQIRFVAWIDRTVAQNALLPVLAAEMIIGSSRAKLIGFGSSKPPGSILDQTAKAAYIEIAKQRGLFPTDLVTALIDAQQSVSIIANTEGQRIVLGGDALDQERSSGRVIQEEILSREGERLQISGDQLRDLNISSQNKERLSGVAEYLDLASLKNIQPTSQLAAPIGRLLEIRGPISKSRLRRWQSNLSATRKQQSTNTWLLDINSDGGNLSEAARFANWLTEPGEPIQTVSGFVSSRATADAAIIALACQPLFLASDSVIGGTGIATPQTAAMNQEVIEIIHAIAESTGRSPGLIEGLIDPSAEIYRFTHRKTGQVRYASGSELVRQLTGDLERAVGETDIDPAANWVRGEKLDLRRGLTARSAIELGLADGIAETTQIAVNKLNMSDFPDAVTDQPLVRAVERLGSSQAFAILLLFIGFAALSAEFSSPGLGIPGFIALLCFALYFWINLLSGTAEWLELVALIVGILCIGIEFFVLPGFGAFGIGGFLITGFSIILMSQTFVVPKNAYQLNAFSDGIWVMLGGLAGLLAGLFAMRTLATRVPVLRALTMEKPDLEAIENAEKLGDYDHLLGQTGIASTPLHPSGKATFGEEMVQVVSDGTAIDPGSQVTVVRVRANHVLVRLTSEA